MSEDKAIGTLRGSIIFLLVLTLINSVAIFVLALHCPAIGIVTPGGDETRNGVRSSEAR